MVQPLTYFGQRNKKGQKRGKKGGKGACYPQNLAQLRSEVITCDGSSGPFLKKGGRCSKISIVGTVHVCFGPAPLQNQNVVG